MTRCRGEAFAPVSSEMSRGWMAGGRARTSFPCRKCFALRDSHPQMDHGIVSVRPAASHTAGATGDRVCQKPDMDTSLMKFLAVLFVCLVSIGWGRTSAVVPQAAPVRYSYPIGVPGRPLGDGFFIRHGYTVENTWYNPGYWHTGTTC